MTKAVTRSATSASQQKKSNSPTGISPLNLQKIQQYCSNNILRDNPTQKQMEACINKVDQLIKHLNTQTDTRKVVGVKESEK